MSKYNETFKLMVVKKYQEGMLGYKLLVKKHGIKSHKQIVNWMNNDKKFGTEG